MSTFYFCGRNYVWMICNNNLEWSERSTSSCMLSTSRGPGSSSSWTSSPENKCLNMRTHTLNWGRGKEEVNRKISLLQPHLRLGATKINYNYTWDLNCNNQTLPKHCVTGFLPCQPLFALDRVQPQEMRNQTKQINRVAPTEVLLHAPRYSGLHSTAMLLSFTRVT